jgi:hypothetical protein
LLEESAIEMFQVVEHYAKKSNWGDFKQQLSDMVKAETEYRRSHGYPSILKADDDNEEYTFRASVLKKYAASVLYLSTDVQREGMGWEQLFFAISAGISMVFATLIAFYFQQQYGNFSAIFFVALVVGYMFKDRVKELGRGMFAQYLENRLYDRRIVIKTQDNQHKLGILKEKVTFIKESDVPNRVQRIRNKDFFRALDDDGRGENVIQYTKEVILNTAEFKNIFADSLEITGINDIIRYDIRSFLKKMGEPVQERVYLQDGELVQMTCHKVYHVNIISRYASPYPEKGKLYKRMSLVLNQAGIKRVKPEDVEEMPANSI